MKLKMLYFSLLVALLSGCSMQPKTYPVLVEIDDAIFVSLPKPAELKQSLNVSQLITAQWGQGKQQKLQVQLQVDKQQVVLAGFSAWGARLLSLNYSGKEIQTSVLSGLTDTLPKPEQVLFNVMLSIWPIESWQAPLSKIGWQLIESPLGRKLLDNNGQVIIDVTYQRLPYIDGVIVFKHYKLDYTITIETNKINADK